MNQRFKELAKQATRIEESDELFPREVFDKEKFVELIVQECLLAIDKTNRHHVHTTFDEQLVEATLQKSKKAVKEHFGL